MKHTMKVIMKINIHKSQCVCVGGGGGWWWRKVLTHEELVPIVKHTMKVIVEIDHNA